MIYGDHNILKGFYFTNKKGVTYAILDSRVKFCVFEVWLVVVDDNFKELEAEFTTKSNFSEYVELLKLGYKKYWYTGLVQ